MDGWSDVQAYPIVLRFQGMYPHQLAGYEAHRMRRGRDLEHVDAERSYRNRRLFGSETWAAEALAKIQDMALENYEAELASLKKRGRKKDIVARMAEGPKQPWRSSRDGPLREVILTANRQWFEGDMMGAVLDRPEMREEQFERHAVQWLRDNFGDDVVHARANRDEACYHIHAVIVPRMTVTIAKAKTGAASATRRMLQPSKHPLIKDYEAAQDSAGTWFADIGLTRGERRAEAIREACRKGETPPDRRYHVRPADWRAEEQLRLMRWAVELDAQQAALDEEDINLERRRCDLNDRAGELDALETALGETQAEIEQRQDELTAREAASDARQAELDASKVELEKDEADVGQREVGLEQREGAVGASEADLAARQAEVAASSGELDRRQVGRDRYQAKLDAQQARFDARQIGLDETQVGLDERAAQLDARHVNLKARERATNDREREADAIIAVADGIASGEIEIADPSDVDGLRDKKGSSPVLRGSSVDALRARSRKGVERAAKAFGTVWSKLRKRGRQEAEKILAIDREQIAAADDAIVDAARHLPPKARSLVASLRKSIRPRLDGLGRRAKARAEEDRSTPPAKKPGGQGPIGDD